MAKNRLKYELREVTGKSAARKLRKSGRVPAVIYGRGEASLTATVNCEELVDLINDLKGKLLITELVPPSGDGYRAAIKSIQRHPLTDEFLNVDFQKIHPGEMLNVSIPIILKGTPSGLKMGGLLEHIRYDLDVRGPVSKLPLHIDVDISELDVGDGIRVKDITFAEGVEVLDPLEGLIVAVVHPRKAKAVEVVAAEEGIEGEEETPEEAAEEAETGEETEEAGEE
ncbi:50S ribosomal protein L25 [candidate division WOR-3 bacterium]|uniref:Large ribosomal subunit protein bL25 n=1 Tax=candidate division WOR-3 bacterium TaxID=2052148 RepID=A0A9D5K791_UNCW3|nr:50S ribosomal protein L25 [candidate division WOR-3 bacterium]MBD3363593.1 50S ribosomal protein L25 [candidate division WOR-3 bacterium]